MSDASSGPGFFSVAPLHTNEEERIASLRKTGLLDSTPDPRFDDITKLAASTFEVTTAVVSLIDVDRQWFLSSCGLSASETSRDVAFCAHTINEDQFMVVGDAQADPRFMNNPLVTSDPYIRFYAGVIISDPSGLPLGTLCIFDPKPRMFGMQEQNTLRMMAKMLGQEIFKPGGN